MGWTARTRKPTTGDAQRPPLSHVRRHPRLTAPGRTLRHSEPAVPSTWCDGEKTKGYRTDAIALRRAIWAAILARVGR